MADLHVGDVAPDFTLPRSGGGTVTLSALRGRPVVLYFYPKDDTPGCTKEACAFRDTRQSFEATGAVVLGVSPDSVAAHNRFAEKYGLPFALLADQDHAVAERYGAWRQRSMYGKKFMGIRRSTFLIEADGRIARIWPQVTVESHAGEVLAALTAPGS